jgi:hypothetical protein
MKLKMKKVKKIKMVMKMRKTTLLEIKYMKIRKKVPILKKNLQKIILKFAKKKK